MKRGYAIMEMSITRALREVKLLDKRISDATRYVAFVGLKKKSSDKVNMVSATEFVEDVKSSFQSVTDLIERRKLIKSAIVKSNAETLVSIGGKSYTVADAIERKNNIHHDKSLLLQLENQYRTARSQMETRNEDVEQRLDKMLEAMLGKDAKNVAKESNEMAQKFLSDNEWEIVDPLGIAKLIVDMKQDIDTFEAEVDFVLSESNSITKIEIAD